MIKPLTSVELTSSKQRTGMASVGELMERLVRSYELQAELMQRRSEHTAQPTMPTKTHRVPSPTPATPISIAPLQLLDDPNESVQSTFAWF